MRQAPGLALLIPATLLGPWMSVLAAAGAPAAPVEVNLGDVCVGLPARGRTQLSLPQPSAATQRQLQSGRPATRLLLNLTPVEGAAGRQQRLDVVLHAAQTGRIDRALDLPGQRGPAARQVRLRARVIECGVPSTSTQELARFLEPHAATEVGAATEAIAASGAEARQEAAGGRGPLPRTASLADRRRAFEERRTWCAARHDPYDTLYKGSGFVPLPWLSEPAWLQVSTTYDQAPPAPYQFPKWTRVEAIPYHQVPRYHVPTWTMVERARLKDQPRVASVGPYSIDDCRLVIWDDYFAWAAAHGGDPPSSTGPGGAKGSATGTATGSASTGPGALRAAGWTGD